MALGRPSSCTFGQERAGAVTVVGWSPLESLEPVWVNNLLGNLLADDVRQLSLSSRKSLALTLSGTRRLIVPRLRLDLACWHPLLLCAVDPQEVVDFVLSIAPTADREYDGFGGDVNCCLGWLMAGLTFQSKLRSLTVMAELPEANATEDDSRWEGVIEEPVVRALMGCLSRCKRLESLDMRAAHGSLWWMSDDLSEYVGAKLGRMVQLRVLMLTVAVFSDEAFASLVEGIACCPQLEELALVGASDLDTWMESTRVRDLLLSTERSVRGLHDLLSTAPLRRLRLRHLSNFGSLLIQRVDIMCWPQTLQLLQLSLIGLDDQALVHLARCVCTLPHLQTLYLKFDHESEVQEEAEWRVDSVTMPGIAAFFTALANADRCPPQLQVPWLCSPYVGAFGADLVLKTLETFVRNAPSSLRSLEFAYPGTGHGSEEAWSGFRRAIHDRKVHHSSLGPTEVQEDTPDLTAEHALDGRCGRGANGGASHAALDGRSGLLHRRRTTRSEGRCALPRPDR
ncbi:unnamed protein product [Prorocentrum cordatum]|uniref:Uncharacterized protein n=1 Tax=Prorocentrum cordatum TaxID=2364126 RepID=A0ABN9QT87_9DINO|nr:unnamed protein product [Polarella glacialis]